MTLLGVEVVRGCGVDESFGSEFTTETVFASEVFDVNTGDDVFDESELTFAFRSMLIPGLLVFVFAIATSEERWDMKTKTPTPAAPRKKIPARAASVMGRMYLELEPFF